VSVVGRGEGSLSSPRLAERGEGRGMGSREGVRGRGRIEGGGKRGSTLGGRKVGTFLRSFLPLIRWEEKIMTKIATDRRCVA